MVLTIGAVREEFVVRLRLVSVSLPTEPGDVRCRSTSSLALHGDVVVFVGNDRRRGGIVDDRRDFFEETKRRRALLEYVWIRFLNQHR